MSRLITLGLPPLTAEQARAGQELGAFLEERLEHPVEVSPAANYSELEDNIAEGRADFAWLPPYEALLLRQHVGIAVLLRASRGGAPGYHSALFVRADSPALSEADLEGKRVAWVHRRSASGYLVPAAHLLGCGVTPATPPLFLRSHAAVVEAVARGDADAGATYATLHGERTLPEVDQAAWHQVLPESGPEMRALACPGPIPSDAICAWPGTPLELRRSLAGALRAAGDDPHGAGVLTRLFGTSLFVAEPAEEEADRVLDRALATLAQLSGR